MHKALAEGVRVNIGCWIPIQRIGLNRSLANRYARAATGSESNDTDFMKLDPLRTVRSKVNDLDSITLKR